jgi:hypothetical protein
MVVLDYPDTTCQKFISWNYFMLGPLDANAEYKAVQIELPLQGDRFEPSKGIYDENNIVHSAYHGQVYYYPILADCLPFPDAIAPRQIKVPHKTAGVPNPITAPRGFACPNTGALCDVSASYVTYWAIQRDYPTKSWTFQSVTINRSTKKCAGYRQVVQFQSWYDTKTAWCYVTTTSDAISFLKPVLAHVDPGKEANFEQVMSHFSDVNWKWGSPSTALQKFTVITTEPHVASSPTKLASDLAVFVDELMNRNFPIPEVDYGDLASRAIKQKRLVDTNIYEFLRDLKDIKSLAPKLQNLKSLKTHAGNYLAVKYGVLPTIDDLRKIVGAFKARLPFYDKYGNTNFNASNVASAYSGNCSCMLEQYIKVPVANEDSQLDSLLSWLDEHGLGLTLENVWDLTKYSFAIDWFIDVGGFLERIDNNLRLLRYNIPYVTMSRKKSIAGELPQTTAVPILGPIEWRFYHRWVTSQCPLPPLTLSTTPTISNHWLEAGALLIQRAH